MSDKVVIWLFLGVVGVVVYAVANRTDAFGEYIAQNSCEVSYFVYSGMTNGESRYGDESEPQIDEVYRCERTGIEMTRVSFPNAFHVKQAETRCEDPFCERTL